MVEAEQLAAPGNSSLDEAEHQEARGLGPWMLVHRRRTSRRAHSFVNQQQPSKNAKWVAIGDHSAGHSSFSGRSQGLPKPSCRSGSISSPVAGGRPASATSLEGSPLLQASPSPPPPSSLPPVQEGPVQPHLEVGGCLHSGDGQVTMKWDSTNLDMAQSGMNVQVQDQARCMVQQDDSVEPTFGGFSAMPSCNKECTAPSGASKRSAKKHKKVLLGGKSVVAPLPSLPSDALALVVRPPGPSLGVGTMVPYCKRLYVDELSQHDHEDAPLLIEGCRDLVEGSKEEGHRSLKVERMLNDLGPIASLPRKRRMIALNLDGGDASPSLPP